MTLSFSARTLYEMEKAYKQYKSKALKIEAHIEGDFNTEQMLRMDIWGEHTYQEKEDDMWGKHNIFPPIRMTFLVNGIPVELTINSDMYRGAYIKAKGKISAYTGFKDTSNGKLGFEWQQSDNSVSPINTFQNTFDITYPTIQGKGEIDAKAWFYPRIRFILYDVLGPSIDIKPYLRSKISGGFNKELLSSTNDHSAWSLDNYAGLNLGFGLSFMALGWGYEKENIPIVKDLSLIEKCIYHSPYDIRLLSSTSEKVEKNISNTVTFEVYDVDSLFNKEVLTILPQFVKFEGKGKVSVVWIPSSSKDTLYARLYDVNGKIIKEAKFYGETNINVITEEVSVQNMNAVCFGKLEGIDDLSNVEYGIKINEDYMESSNINNANMFSVNFLGLSEGIYNYCAYVRKNGEYIYGEVKSFMITQEDDTNLKELLIQLYKDTDGDNWTNNTNWNSDKPISEWYGVTYGDPYGMYGRTVLQLNLTNNNLNGTINMKGCTELVSLFCDNNRIKEIDISYCTQLNSLTCRNNLLTKLDVTNCNNSTSFRIDCFNNGLTSLDLTTCTTLSDLNCNNNKITSLTILEGSFLERVECANNKLSQLRISRCYMLSELRCYNNQLTSLDLSDCSALKTLMCEKNKINAEIPEYFKRLDYFKGDQKYIYEKDKYGSTVSYTTNPYGWWYPGEPDQGYHGW